MLAEHQQPKHNRDTWESIADSLADTGSSRTFEREIDARGVAAYAQAMGKQALVTNVGGQWVVDVDERPEVGDGA